jgi:thymidylate kinase
MQNLSGDGLLFVFEGPDGVGKTSTVRQVGDRLSARTKRRVRAVSFPGSVPGTLGELVYQLHHSTKRLNRQPTSTSLQMMHVAAHIDALENEILPTLNEGDIVLLDRYWWSTIVYGQMSGANAEFLTAMINIELKAWQSKSPTALFLLRRDAELHAEPTPFNSLAAQYDELANIEKGKYPIIKLNNDSSLQTVTTRVIEHIEFYIEQSG